MTLAPLKLGVLLLKAPERTVTVIHNYSDGARHIRVSNAAKKIPLLSEELLFHFSFCFSVATHRVLHKAERGWWNSEPQTHRHMAETLSGMNRSRSTITHFHRAFQIWSSIIFLRIWCLVPKETHVRFD